MLYDKFPEAAELMSFKNVDPSICLGCFDVLKKHDINEVSLLKVQLLTHFPYSVLELMIHVTTLIHALTCIGKFL